MARRRKTDKEREIKRLGADLRSWFDFATSKKFSNLKDDLDHWLTMNQSLYLRRGDWVKTLAVEMLQLMVEDAKFIGENRFFELKRMNNGNAPTVEEIEKMRVDLRESLYSSQFGWCCDQVDLDASVVRTKIERLLERDTTPVVDAYIRSNSGGVLTLLSRRKHGNQRNNFPMTGPA